MSPTRLARPSGKRSPIFTRLTPNSWENAARRSKTLRQFKKYLQQWISPKRKRRIPLLKITLKLKNICSSKSFKKELRN
jgi:hypothetical protein